MNISRRKLPALLAGGAVAALVRPIEATEGPWKIFPARPGQRGVVTIVLPEGGSIFETADGAWHFPDQHCVYVGEWIKQDEITSEREWEDIGRAMGGAMLRHFKSKA